MVHYAIETTVNPTGDFKGFLVTNPQLADGGLFLEYYSAKLMLRTPETRKEVALPDKKQLPSFVGGAPGTPGFKARGPLRSKLPAAAHTQGDEEAKAGTAGVGAGGGEGAGAGVAGVEGQYMRGISSSVPSIRPSGDDEGAGAGAGAGAAAPAGTAPTHTSAGFLEAARANKLSSWGHTHLLRVVWAALRMRGRRSGGLDEALGVLATIQGRYHSYTVSFFWAHMVTVALFEDGWDGEPVSGGGEEDEPSFAAFLAKHAELDDARLINSFYSADALKSDAAATEFVLADKKPLPNPVRPA